MIDELPDAPDPVNDLPEDFSNKAAAFVLAQKAMVPQINTVLANMSTIAAGGAYAIPYTFDTATSNSDPGSGKLRLSSASQSSATQIYLDLLGADGVDYTGLLDLMDASTSAVKGQLLLYKQGDKSKYLFFDVTARATLTGYRQLNMTPRGSSAANPFVNGDSLVLAFQRTGDKGDAGSLTNVLWVRDEKASGQTGGSAAASTYVTRTLNTVKKNTISGASLSGNQITLPAGTYRIDAIAPANNVGQHQAYLYNVTDAVTQVTGANGYAGGSAVATYSVIGKAEFTIAAAKTFEIRHWTNTSTASTGLGNAVSSGQGEVFTQVFIEKVA